jgi:hypothetical protein
MVGATRWLIRRRPRIAIAAVIVCWYAAPLAFDNGRQYWRETININYGALSPAAILLLKTIDDAVAMCGEAIGWTTPAVAFMLYFAAPLLVLEYKALKNWRREVHDVDA